MAIASVAERVRWAALQERAVVVMATPAKQGMAPMRVLVEVPQTPVIQGVLSVCRVGVQTAQFQDRALLPAMAVGAPAQRVLVR